MFGFKKLISTVKKEQIKIENVSLSKEEHFALALGDLEYERLKNEIEELALINYLKKEYGREFSAESIKNDTIYILQKLWSEGSMHLIWNHTIEFGIEVRDIVAFDAARFTEFIRQLLILKLIEEELAWGWLFLNAQRVQDSYQNWQDFKEAYFKGLTLYRYGKKEEVEQYRFNFEIEYKNALNNSTVVMDWLEEEIFSHFESVENKIIKE